MATRRCRPRPAVELRPSSFMTSPRLADDTRNAGMMPVINAVNEATINVNRRTVRSTVASCASGTPADDRILGPQIVRSSSMVLVIFAIRPRGGSQSCQSNPATRVPVDLGEALGTRLLLDGGRLPFGDPTMPA